MARFKLQKDAQVWWKWSRASQVRPVIVKSWTDTIVTMLDDKAFERSVPRESIFRTESQATISLLRDDVKAKKMQSDAAQKAHRKSLLKLDKAIAVARRKLSP